MSNEIERIARSLAQLYDAGELDELSCTTLEAPDVKAAVAAGLGERSTADEVLLTTLLIDDSASIAPNIAEVRRGHNTMLEALLTEQTPGDVRVQTRALNYGVLSPYRPVSQAMMLDSTNFGDKQISSAGTPLYLQSLITLGTVMMKAREEAERGAKVRTFTLIITDAEDNRSGDITVRHVRQIVTNMLEFATNHIVAGMGIGERHELSFHEIFRAMGIQRRWMFSSAADVDRLREEFDKITRELRLAASSEAAFLQLVAGSSGP
jgi:hypothetical protein